MGESQEAKDTEITLGTGKLLGMFFGLVGVCALFFIMGYTLGRNSGSGDKGESLNVTAGGSSTGKPSAVNKPAEAAATPVSSGPDSSFYNTVAGKASNAQLTPDASAQKDPASSGSSKGASVGDATAAPKTLETTAPTAANPVATETKSASTGPFMVQVAAVSKQEDAEILVSALRKKQYPVFVASNVPGDMLFHVQVGPFADQKEAEAMRSRLSGDGYNAIVKK
ncbi:MAG TPA: SPOR domain-containing protein [Candidatus Angelobacter sp.]|nr:SPOR domain-containing protein [Candidatus Angelobacter sp.]